LDRVAAISREQTRAASAQEVADWEGAYRDLLPKVFRFFCYRVGDEHIAEDLTATTFEQAWRGRWRYRRDLGAFPSWLFGIARNVAAGHFRSHREELGLESAASLGSDDPPEDSLQWKSDFERLSVLLKGLAQREREIVSLKYGGALTNRMIARVMGLTETNVGTLLHRVVGRLRAGWEAEA
jgi:RNA polymerase sigma-70 factor (ECF subfamily)